MADKGVLGGIVMIVVAVVWFVIGWMNGYIYFYPPILAVVGLISIGNGLTRRPPVRSRRRRARDDDE